ncbi:MAG TPA: rod shape-determining protein MreD [Roseiflexaceae bacterium]|nr:rod shape-determining protein MreD [Roseiflexaceae bacterium]
MDNRRRRRIEERIAAEVLLALLLLLLALLQSALLPRPYGVTPNLLLVLVVCQGLLAGPTDAVRWAFYAGIGLDLCSGSLIGSHALALLGAVLLATLPLIRLSRGNWLAPLLGVTFGACAYHAILALIIYLSVAPVPLDRYLLVSAVPEAAAALVPALPLYMLLHWQRTRRYGEVAIDVY